MYGSAAMLPRYRCGNVAGRGARVHVAIPQRLLHTPLRNGCRLLRPFPGNALRAAPKSAARSNLPARCTAFSAAKRTRLQQQAIPTTRCTVKHTRTLISSAAQQAVAPRTVRCAYPMDNSPILPGTWSRPLMVGSADLHCRRFDFSGM